jgi:hypothetical protein
MESLYTTADSSGRRRSPAETDRDALEFYRAYGFAVQNLGEKYPGTIPFLDTYSVGGEEAESSEGAL